MPRFLRDPLFVCLLLGLAVFVLDRWLDRGGDRAVYVGASDLARLQAQWAAQGGRPPTPRELQGLVEEHIREEILSREAQALGLDRGDVIIRRRLVQKLRFVTEDIALETAPDPVALEAFFNEHADRYAAPERVTFSHVYFSSDRHDDARELARDALAELSGQNGEAWLEVGDPFLLNRTYADRTLTDVRELFGSAFAEGIAELETGPWSVSK